MPLKTLPLEKARALIEQKRSEDDVQQEIMVALRVRGYIVLQTSEHRRRVQCPHCDGWFTPKTGRGCDKGVPDLLIARDDWLAGVWLGLEVKGGNTKVSDEQKDLAARGRIFIVKSLAAAQVAISGIAAKLTNPKKEL